MAQQFDFSSVGSATHFPYNYGYMPSYPSVSEFQNAYQRSESTTELHNDYENDDGRSVICSSDDGGSTGNPSTPPSDDLIDDSPMQETGSRKRKRPIPKGKPPFSYIALISMAIASSSERKLTLHDIYKYITDRYPYYDNHSNMKGWKGSIRHNLALNDCFVKLPRKIGMKGHEWVIDPAFEDMFDHGSFLRRRYRVKDGGKRKGKTENAPNVIVQQSGVPVPMTSVPNGDFRLSSYIHESMYVPQIKDVAKTQESTNHPVWNPLNHQQSPAEFASTSTDTASPRSSSTIAKPDEHSYPWNVGQGYNQSYPLYNGFAMSHNFNEVMTPSYNDCSPFSRYRSNRLY